ncbi:uncharacterized protein K460DRAFT_367969 [Cucurbitaria berberidis CBS 394.84]|uniref:Uncharacterized protein n=1 Tax=Cucurbitaria berberidis CBS 394.84 TaxID=1168544 RepID=A0A9P4L6G7_9PLEO|nr:uncharacterized protein K460DRAFT_367969 [Cucurbitaria berberidis CBS 394.84]KAF1843038.1 hypothetical protein K460DRAFT_367969 [Cucurbitaria berberidis CBS 394.84]
MNRFGQSAQIPTPLALGFQHERHGASSTCVSSRTLHQTYAANNDPRPSVPIESSRPYSITSLQQPSYTMIGSVYVEAQTGKYQFRCHLEGCNGKPCSRLQELKRHYESKHEDSAMWCPFQDCERSENTGTDPFSAGRKDNLKEHVKRMHSTRYARWLQGLQ